MDGPSTSENGAVEESQRNGARHPSHATRRRAEVSQPDVAVSTARSTRDTASPRRWHLDARVGADFPLALSGRLVLQAPGRLRVMVEAGGLPEGFEDLGHTALTALGVYDAAMAAVVDDAIRTPIVGMVAVGIGPKKKSGFAFDVGYRAMWLSTGPIITPLFSMIANQPIPASYDIFADGEASMQTTIHQVSVRAGWEWIAARRLTIRFDVGGSFTFEASHRLRLTSEDALPPGYSELLNAAEAELDRILQKRAHVPTVGLSLGYRFF